MSTISVKKFPNWNMKTDYIISISTQTEQRVERPKSRQSMNRITGGCCTKILSATASFYNLIILCGERRVVLRINLLEENLITGENRGVLLIKSIFKGYIWPKGL